MFPLPVPGHVISYAYLRQTEHQRDHVRHTVVSAGLSFLLGLAINQLILLLVHRIRPYDAGVTQLFINPSADWSFPSDRATASLAVVASFALYGLRRRALALFVLAVIMCWSRVYVGTHYVTDILGGAATGVIASLLVMIAYREITRFDRFTTWIF